MITITDTSAGVAELRSPYDPDLVAMIKQEVPGYARRWDPDRKVWTIEKFYVEALVRSLRAVGFTVDYTPRQHRRPPPPREARAALGAGPTNCSAESTGTGSTRYTARSAGCCTPTLAATPSSCRS